MMGVTNIGVKQNGLSSDGEIDYADVSTLLITQYNAFVIVYHPNRIYLSSATAPPIYKLVCNYRI